VSRDENLSYDMYTGENRPMLERKVGLEISMRLLEQYLELVTESSVADPDPNPDPPVFRPPGSGYGSTNQRYGPGSGSCSGSGSRSFYHHAKTVRKTFIPTIL
jgi:hypothetical protein